MFAVGTYDEIIEIEKRVEEKQIVVFLFVRPTNQNAMEIIKEFEYIHYNSEEYCSIYAIGYTNDFDKANDTSYIKIQTILNSDWYFSNKAFVEFKNNLESRIKWKYSGETEILILQNNPNKKNLLNFSNYVAINVNKGLRDGYIDSFQLFMESLMRSSRNEVTAREAIADMRISRLRIKDIISDSIKDCKAVPTPIQEIITDRLFYRCANTISTEPLLSEC